MQNQQPRNQMLGNALRNTPSTQNYRQPNMLSPNQYGSPTPQMSNMQMPQSMPQGPIGMSVTPGQNRFGVGLARPMPQNTQVS